MKKTVFVLLVIMLLVFCSSCKSTRIDMIAPISETVVVNLYEESETNRPVSFSYPSAELHVGVSWKYSTLFFGLSEYFFGSPGMSKVQWDGDGKEDKIVWLMGYGPRYELLDGKIELSGGLIIDLLQAQSFYRERGSTLQKASFSPYLLGLFLKTKFVVAEDPEVEGRNYYIGFNISAMPGHMTYTYRDTSQKHTYSYTREHDNLSLDSYMVRCSIGVGVNGFPSLKRKK